MHITNDDIDQEGRLVLILTAGALGSADITISATDPSGLFANHTFSVTVGVPPIADLTNPAAGASIDDLVINGRGFILVRFIGQGDVGLDPGRILDPQPKFVLTGSAASGVTVDPVPV